MSKIYITGISGTGKSTLAKELSQRGVVVFDIDAVEGLCHWRHKETHKDAHYRYGIGGEWLEAHEWICDMEMLQKLLNTENGHVVVVGCASNQNEFLYLFDKIFLLQCKEETFLQRLSTRDGDNQFAKEKSEQGIVLAVGPGEFQDGKLVAVGVKVHDKVAFSKYGYEDIRVDGEELFLIKEESILAIIK